jgi:hypothetical protein
VSEKTNQMSQRRNAVERIKCAALTFLASGNHPGLHGHKIDDHAKQVLGRLYAPGRNSDRLIAAEAIIAAVPEAGWHSLFADCIYAELRARNHESWLQNAQSTNSGAKSALQEYGKVWRFLGYPNSKNPDFAKVLESKRGDPVLEALQIIHGAIAAKARLADEHSRLVSRKKTPEAARAEGAGWIRESIEKICGRLSGFPEPRFIAVIASAALNMGEMTPDAVRKAPKFTERLNQLQSGAFNG